MNISKGARSFDKCKVKTVNTSKRLGNVGGFVNAETYPILLILIVLAYKT